MVAPPTPTDKPLGEATDAYLDDCRNRVAVGGLSRATVTAYSGDLRRFTELIGEHVLVDHITGEDVDDALLLYAKEPDRRYTNPERKRTAGHGPGTQQRFRNTLTTFFGFCAAKGWVQVSPMQWSTLTPRHRGGLSVRRTALSGGQAAALLTHGPGPEQPDPGSREGFLWRRDRLALAMLLLLGPRASELVGATDDAFTSHPDGTQTWRIVGKGGKVRHVPLSSWLVTVKDDYLSARRMVDVRDPAVDGLLWRSAHGGRWGVRDVERLLSAATHRVAAVDRSAAREATPHALRHTCATLLLAAGWDVKVVKQMLGHTSLATTGAYLDELPGELAEAVARHPLAPTSR